jgi:hypothetical protein
VIVIELRLNQSTGKYEKPGVHTHGRVYMVIDQMTGEVAYNCTTSDLPGLDPNTLECIRKYDTFGGWMTEIISADETKAKVFDLNRGPREFVETKHTRLVARVKRRLAEQNDGVIDGFYVIDDMRAMYADLTGVRHGNTVPGWKV